MGDAAEVRIHGFVAPGYEAVADEFRTNFTERGDHGAGFAAVVDGRTVVDLWGGWADSGSRRPWREDTIAGIFSGTKGFVATCLLLLIERGQLQLDSPVGAYWPEFAARGKERILVRHLVSHQACLPGLATPVSVEEATDDVRMARLLADQSPVREPGTILYYHALTFGWLCGELIRRIDGRSVGRLFAEDVARPLGLDAWIGLPPEQEPRVAVLERGENYGAKRSDLDTDRVAWSIWDNPPRSRPYPLPLNSRSWRAAEVPGGNGIASARAAARLYGCLARGGELEGTRILRPETIALGYTCLARGVEPYLEQELAYGVGFGLQTREALFGSVPVGFGHDGAGGSLHGAWPTLKTGFSYVTNTLRQFEGHDPRSGSLLAALSACVQSP
ncbi:serine hydrolase domain-containing protein [Mesorhizobium sp. ES1-1]|uniref:serine hydrolase domain-containing protein n=1 Tax=Mesorhizobium sp. ES1-1 TaxID=2876629 RepID=UPI001CCB7747|nr:serine hydrolase domain-containing protein [Mesorhizobium sp. ES1-1]MBZ9676306.1 beta-lactamase family protein [Mesorhizobium sp. ES1-1]